MSTYGISVSKPGVNARTVSDKDSQFKGSFTTLKILKSGEAAFQTNGSGNGSLSVRHGLGFSPAFYVFRKGTASFSFLDATSYSNCYFPNPEATNEWISGTFSCYTTTSDLIISATSQAANTIYTFKYYIFIDLAQDFSGNQIFTLKNQYGIEIGKSGKNVKTSQDYEKSYSNKYRSLQYYKESFQAGALPSLPAMNGRVNSDTSSSIAQEGSYVDIQHGLGYPPFFLVFATSTSLSFLSPVVDGGGIFDTSATLIHGWCNNSIIRITHYRENTGTTSSPDGGGLGGSSFINYKCFIFTEDLAS